MRRVLQLLAAVAALVVLAMPVQAQMTFGAHGAVITSVDDLGAIDPSLEDYGLSGTFGLGGRIVISPPIAPLSFVGAGEYYFVDCPDGADCQLWTASAAVNLAIPLVLVQPYVTGGIQYRGDNDDENSDTAWIAGLGVQLNLGVSVFLEGLFEFVDRPDGFPDDLDVRPFVLKAGIVF